MQLLLDVSPLLEPVWTGIPMFTARLTQSLFAQSEIEPVFLIRGDLVSQSAVRRSLAMRTGIYLRADWERRRGIFDERPHKLRHVLFPSVKTRYGMLMHEGSVVHDLSTLVTQEFHTRENVRHHLLNVEAELRTNEVTFAVSEATKSDLVYYFGLAPDDVSVIYQYANFPVEFEEAFHNQFGGRDHDDFVLVLGTIEPRKNARIVFSVLKEIMESCPDLTIVFAGAIGWHAAMALGDISTYLESGRIRFSGYVSEYQKYCLLRMSRFSVYPSVFEGFGIPVLESLCVGTPVLASFSSSIPEVGKEAVSYFDPLSSDDFLEKFLALYRRTETANAELVDPCKEAAAFFTPARMIEPIRQWMLASEGAERAPVPPSRRRR